MDVLSVDPSDLLRLWVDLLEVGDHGIPVQGNRAWSQGRAPVSWLLGVHESTEVVPRVPQFAQVVLQRLIPLSPDEIPPRVFIQRVHHGDEVEADVVNAGAVRTGARRPQLLRQR